MYGSEGAKTHGSLHFDYIQCLLYMTICNAKDENWVQWAREHMR